MKDLNPSQGGIEDWLEAATRVGAALVKTAVARDREGRDPVEEIALLRASGLLTIAIPSAQGGGGATASEILRVIRKLAEADTSLAQLMSYHLFGTRIGLGGTNEDLRARRLEGFLKQGWFHAGIAQAAYPPLLEAKNDGAGYVINGAKPFTSGAAVADTLQVWVRFAEGATVDGADVSCQIGQFIVANPTEGLRFGGDWDAIGQRQTVSGGATLENVRVSRADLVNAAPEGTAHPPHVTVHVPVIQLSFAELYIGTAKGALRAARDYIATQGRAWVSSGYAKAGDDPLIVERFGRLSAQLAAAEALADAAGQRADAALAQGPALTEGGRGALAVIAYQAKIAAHEAGLEVTSRIFELMGARAAARSYGFDRFWRNIRTHTLHDPIHYKTHEVGDWALNGRFPAPDYYR
ncbi:acyl-CoA dehydrogenase family protein [Paracoccus aminophilus]|uniref:Acyl-CoA dehydrogenase n=1 Tax=Paracoccus aminophilus JCM 7686 TaxID=1367847 RepID=S5YH48_PARAH|nr:acyl-CoA dehydrogenase family protein [Paracoccus aminophilus]AGT10793.1 acyl-CoA dehydrogenase [Paracoccus aminophilus JCM 7686]